MQSSYESFPWENDYVDIKTRFISDKESEYLSGKFPQYDSIVRRGCPTCKGPDSTNNCGDCRKQLQLYKHYLLAGIGITYQQLGWEDFVGDPSALSLAKEYLSKHDRYVNGGYGFLLHGKYGTGKTLVSILVAKELVKLGYKVYFATFSQMVEEFTRSWGDNSEKIKFEKNVVKSDIFFLDDIGKELKTRNNLPETTFDYVLRQRVLDARPTFITTNMTVPEIMNGYGSAIFSLLTEKMLEHEVLGEDYRPNVIVRGLSEINGDKNRSIK